MREFVFQSEVWLPRNREDVFPFFADAANLQRLTPDFLHFRIVTPLPIVMKEGALIDYRIKVRGIPMGWRTRISIWEPSRRFVDEQLKGPYRQWIHEHRFEEENGGTRCTDLVRYSVWGGALIDSLLVRKDVEKIFAYRNAALKELFPKLP